MNQTKNQRSVTISRQLWTLNLFTLAVVGIIGFFGFFSTKNLSNDIKTFTMVQIPAVRLMGQIDMLHDALRSNVYRAVIATKMQQDDHEETLKESIELRKKMAQTIEELGKVELDTETRAALTTALPLINTYVKSAEDIVEKSMKDDINGVSKSLPDFLKVFDKLEQDLEILGDLIEKKSQEFQANSAKDADHLRYFITMATFISLLISFLFGTRIIRHLTRALTVLMNDLSQESQTMAKNASLLSETAQQLQARVQQQAASLEQTASSLTEIAATSKKTDESAHGLLRHSQQGLDSAQKGQTLMTDLVKKVLLIKETNEKILSQLTKSNSQFSNIVTMISEIDKKTQVINDIVLQTKLLSFNASVEAARAGEHGKGFAVVADEVGKLAEMSGSAAQDIATMVGSSVEAAQALFSSNATLVGRLVAEGSENVEAGHVLTQHCQGALQDILRAAAEIEGMVSQITNAIKEQSLGIQEIGGSVSIIEETNQANARASAHTADTSTSLLNQVHALNAMIARLQQLVTGS